MNKETFAYFNPKSYTLNPNGKSNLSLAKAAVSLAIEDLESRVEAKARAQVEDEIKSLTSPLATTAQVKQALRRVSP